MPFVPRSISVVPVADDLLRDASPKPVIDSLVESFAGGVCGLPEGPLNFAELLQRLGKAHDEELAGLRQENKRLRGGGDVLRSFEDPRERLATQQLGPERPPTRAPDDGLHEPLGEPQHLPEQVLDVQPLLKVNSSMNSPAIQNQVQPLLEKDTSKGSKAFQPFLEKDISRNSVASVVSELPGNLSGEPLGLQAMLEQDERTRKQPAILLALRGTDDKFLLKSIFQLWAKDVAQVRKALTFSLRKSWEPSCNEEIIEDMRRQSVANLDVAKAISRNCPDTETGGRGGFYNRMGSARHSGSGQRTSLNFRGESVFLHVSFANWIILRPGGSIRMAWEILGALMLFVDIVMVPLSAFELERSPFIATLDWLTLTFWSLDIILSCISGYDENRTGRTVMDLKKILRHYARTWLAMDLFIVVPDWVLTIVQLNSGASGSAANSARVLRAGRTLRTVRLLRLMKLQRILAMLRDRIVSEVMLVVVNIWKLVAMLLVVNHFLAATWYTIGNISSSFDGASWVDGFADADISYRYTTALHWSLTQFTPGSMSVEARNTGERAFTIVVLVSGLVIFSSFVSSITASMTQIRNMSDSKTEQFWLLRRYLRQRNVPSHLSFRVLRYVEYACREQSHLVKQERVAVLTTLSDQLRGELMYEISFSVLLGHPLFEHLSKASAHTMHRLSSVAFSQKSLAAKDELFTAGVSCSTMHTVVSGELLYKKAYYVGRDASDQIALAQDWLCEPAMWTSWITLGVARALTECKLIVINVEKFEAELKTDALAWTLLQDYAMMYVQWLNGRSCGHLSDIQSHDSDWDLLASLVNSDDVTRQVS